MSRFVEHIKSQTVEQRVGDMEEIVRMFPGSFAVMIATTVEDLEATLKLAKKRFPEAVEFLTYEKLEQHECSGVQVIFEHIKGQDQ